MVGRNTGIAEGRGAKEVRKTKSTVEKRKKGRKEECKEGKVGKE